MTILAAPVYITLVGAGPPGAPTYTIDLLSLDGTSVVNANTPFQAARITWAADGTNAAEIDLRASDVADGRWVYGQRRIAIKNKNGERVYCGWLDRLERSGGPSDIKYRAASRGLAAMLYDRVVHGNVDKVAVVATTIATSLLQHIDVQTDDVTNFTIGSITGVARALTRYYCDGDNVGEAIDELAADFAWEIDALGAFNAKQGGFGANKTATRTLAQNKINDLQVTGDITEAMTYVTGLAANEQENCGPALVVDFDPLRTTYGRREATIDSESTTEFQVEEETTEELRARLAARLNVRASWIEGRGPWAFEDVVIGDRVTGELGTAFGGNATIRCISKTLTLESRFEFTEWEFEGV